MGDINYLEVLNNILNNNNNNHDNRPSIDDAGWKQVTNNLNNTFHIIKGHKKYRITDKLLDQMYEFSNIYNKLANDNDGQLKVNKDNSNKEKIATVYLLQDRESDYKYIGYTTCSMVNFIKLNIHKFNMNEDSVFDNFGKDDLSNYEFRILEYVKYNNRSDITSRCDIYKDEYFSSDSNNNSNNNNDDSSNCEICNSGGSKDVNDLDKFMKIDDCVNEQMVQSRMDVFFDALGKYGYIFKPFPGYIYEIINKKNKKKFIGGYEHELIKKELLDSIVKRTDNSKIKNDLCRYGRRFFDVNLIEKYNAKTPFDFMLRIDYLKTKDNTIDNGYNREYCLEESENLFKKRMTTSKKDQISRSFFLRIQKLIFYRDFKDQIDYKDIYGYAYQIKNKKNGKRYFAYTHGKTLKQVIKKMYEDASRGNIKHDKMLIALSEVPFEDFHFKIKKIKAHDDYKLDLSDEAEKLVYKYNTIEDGYNFNPKALKKNIFISKFYN
jgi:hypothetical protein